MAKLYVLWCQKMCSVETTTTTHPTGCDRLVMHACVSSHSWTIGRFTIWYFVLHTTTLIKKIKSLANWYFVLTQKIKIKIILRGGLPDLVELFGNSVIQWESRLKSLLPLLFFWAKMAIFSINMRVDKGNRLVFVWRRSSEKKKSYGVSTLWFIVVHRGSCIHCVRLPVKLFLTFELETNS